MGAAQVALALGLVLALLGALILWRRARRAWSQSGLPKGRVVYADMGRWKPCKPLYAPRLGLAGKPDYLVQVGRQIIPVEVKPSRRAPEPYDADVLQLAAYCLLVEETTGIPPEYGLLRYREQTFRIPYGPALRQAVLETLSRMRRDLQRASVPRSHEEPARCRFCGHRADCRESLVKE
jgi:CRISPR-associated exonuclease Cas4